MVLVTDKHVHEVAKGLGYSNKKGTHVGSVMTPAAIILHLFMHIAAFMYNYAELILSQIWHGLQENCMDHKCWVSVYMVIISYDMALSHDSLCLVSI